MTRNPSLHNTQISRRVSTGLLKIGLAVKSRAWKTGHHEGLTPTQAQVLQYLQTPQGSGAGLSSVAQALAITRPTASAVLTALAGKGMVRKHKARNDSRAVELKLTRRGKTAADAASHWPDFLHRAVDCLSGQEQEVLLGSLIKIIYTLHQRGEIPVARMCIGCSYFQPRAHDDPKTPHHCRFADAPIGNRDLRLECPDHIPAIAAAREEQWALLHKITVHSQPAGNP